MTDERQCRFCLDNGDTDENRLFRPCLCSGTQAYIHESCLDLWRESAPNSTYFFDCPTCHYRYRLKRVGAYHLITHWLSLSIATLFLGVTVVLIDAYFVRLLAVLWDPAAVSLSADASLMELSLDCVVIAIVIIGMVVFIVAIVNGDLTPRDFPFPGTVVPEHIPVAVIFTGMGYFFYYTYKALHRHAHRMLRAAGDRVLEIKKLE